MRALAIRPQIVGIVNVTTDSFSDGGLYVDRENAVAHALRLVAEGADIVDIGGESTRPGAARVPEEVELSRVIPVVGELARAGVKVSIDTMRSRVAELAIEAGAAVVNDVSGGLADRRMASVVRDGEVLFVVTHWRGHSERMLRRARYSDVVAEVRNELRMRRDAIVAQGVEPDLVVLDPGIGFAKTSEQSWTLLGALPSLRGLGHPLMVGVSRKSLLRAIGDDLDLAERDQASALLAALVAAHASYLRVHDVASTVLALRVVDRLIGDPAR
ncbi:dihydropteroate synthase [Nocardioides humi]|uniref:Dihydropteroate synthase n=1 Tax=Nocardioides humi TaxID=449461 RepID=A0ABN2BS09_9ACTN|nr:dihydropteroate synthase [Nocardioides humi]